MTTVAAPGPAPAAPAGAWRTRDIVVTAVIGVAFGVIFAAWNLLYPAFAFLPPVLQDWGYGIWLVPAVLAPLIIRRPGAALFAEMAAASLSALLGSQWGPDTLLSGFMQGFAAEVVFWLVRYRSWSVPVLGAAAIASALAAWVHDWFIYYPGAAVELQAARLVVMGASAIVFAALGSLALARALRRAGVLEGLGR